MHALKQWVANTQAYDGMMFREALKTGWYDLQKARDTYRSFVQEEGMHKDLALKYAKVAFAHTSLDFFEKAPLRSLNAAQQAAWTGELAW